MSRRNLAVAGASLAASLIGFVQPAHANDGYVVVTEGSAAFSQELGNGTVAAALCAARAYPGVDEIPVATTVWCSVGTFRSPKVTMAGAHAAVTIADASSDSSVEFCVFGEAIFVPIVVGVPRTVAAVPDCFYV